MLSLLSKEKSSKRRVSLIRFSIRIFNIVLSELGVIIQSKLQKMINKLIFPN
jgi:hypothetical protein